MSDYCSIEDFQSYGYQIPAGQETATGIIITNASRLFDRYVGVDSDYYAYNDASGAASARTFWGDGSNFLTVDPHLAASTPVIAAPTGFTCPDYVAIRKPHFFAFQRTYGTAALLFEALEGNTNFDGQLFANDISNSGQAVGWGRGIPYSVTAKWGWSAVPADIKEAVLETALAIFRGKDSAFARVINMENATVINSAMPDRAKLIADIYRAQRLVFA